MFSAIGQWMPLSPSAPIAGYGVRDVYYIGFTGTTGEMSTMTFPRPAQGENEDLRRALHDVIEYCEIEGHLGRAAQCARRALGIEDHGSLTANAIPEGD